MMFDSLDVQIFFTQFHFIRPLLLLLLIPMLVLLYLRWRQETVSDWQSMLPLHLKKVLTIGDSGWKKQLPLKLLTVMMALGIIAAAGPTWVKQASPFGEDKASLVVVLDNSLSMQETDIAPSRLERAKHKVIDLLNLRGGGSTGLVVYSGSGHLAMPITQDPNVFKPFLSAITPDVMPMEGKVASTALPYINQQLGGENAGSVLLITDGVDQQTISEYEVFFNQHPHQLIILAMGNNAVVSNSPLNMESLVDLADATNGHLLSVSVDSDDVSKIQSAVERNMLLNGESDMPWVDMGYWLLFPITLLLLFWFRRGWLVQWCVLVVLLSHSMPAQVMAASSLQSESLSQTLPQSLTQPELETVRTPESVTSQPVTSEPIASKTNVAKSITFTDKATRWWMDLWLSNDQQGQWYFEQKNYIEAARRYDDPLNKGIAYYYGREYNLAHSAFLQAKSDLGLLNAATALARQRHYPIARDMLLALLKTPDLDESIRAAATQNLAAMKYIIGEINRTSEDQKNTSEGPEESMELGDNPQTSDGSEEQVVEEYMETETLNAAEILGSEELANKWLERVDSDPSFFLQAKFHIQLHEQSQGAKQ